MEHNRKEFQPFHQLRAEATRKKHLETELASLTDQYQALSSQAETCKRAKQEAEKELATLESNGPMGLLYTLAGGKSTRLEEARQALRTAQTDDQQAAFALADAQARLFQIQRELESLAGSGDAFAAARQSRSAALKSADLAQSQHLMTLEKGLAQTADWKQALAALCTQCRTAIELSEKTLHLAEKQEVCQDFSSVQLLQYAADQTLQAQQNLERDLVALSSRLEEALSHTQEAMDDLLAQDIPSPAEDSGDASEYDP